MKQSRGTFQGVRKDPNFGELYVGGYKPASLDYLFISVQTVNPKASCDRLPADYYAYPREVLHADETTIQVLHEPRKAPQSESYMWLYCTSGDTRKPIVLYEHQPGRKTSKRIPE